MAINTRHVALRNDAWRAEALHVRREYAKTRYDIPLFKLHELDPTKVSYLSMKLFLLTIEFYLGSPSMRSQLFTIRKQSQIRHGTTVHIS